MKGCLKIAALSIVGSFIVFILYVMITAPTSFLDIAKGILSSLVSIEKEDKHILVMNEWINIKRSGDCGGGHDVQIKTKKNKIVVDLSLGASTPCDGVEALWTMNGDIARIQIKRKPDYMCIECVGLVESYFEIPKEGVSGIEIIDESGVIIKKLYY